MKKAGTPKNTEPHLNLTLVGVDKIRKWIHVKTEYGTKMLLAYDGKAGVFHLHCYRPLGELGGKVYNNWTLHDDVNTEEW